jgi:D-glycerate 3-kinase
VSSDSSSAADLIEALVRVRLTRERSVPLVLGLCGAQGSGKSTVADSLQRRLDLRGLRVATLSIDDLYLPIADRAQLALNVHPLFRTRGVPGTHDIPLAFSVLDASRDARPVSIPRFDKASDERAPARAWTLIDAPLDILIFEGWCVGAVAEPESALEHPVNSLELLEDGQSLWRRHVNACLAGPYAALFQRLDILALLAAPEFDCVADWRTEQEQRLRRTTGNPGAGMADQEVRRFIQHFERLTRHVLRDMPQRADLVVNLDRGRRVVSHFQKSCGSAPDLEGAVSEHLLSSAEARQADGARRD